MDRERKPMRTCCGPVAHSLLVILTFSRLCENSILLYAAGSDIVYFTNTSVCTRFILRVQD